MISVISVKVNVIMQKTKEVRFIYKSSPFYFCLFSFILLNLKFFGQFGPTSLYHVTAGQF